MDLKLARKIIKIYIAVKYKIGLLRELRDVNFDRHTNRLYLLDLFRMKTKTSQ